MFREPVYPPIESYLEVLEPGGGEVVFNETTERLDDVVEVLRAAHVFNYGVQLRNYWRHDHLDLYSGTAVIEWEVTVWTQAADLGTDREGNLRKAREELEVELQKKRHTRLATQAEASRTVQVVCPGSATTPSSLGDYPGRGQCSGCGRRDAAVRLDGKLKKHPKDVPAADPEAQLPRWGATPTPPPRTTSPRRQPPAPTPPAGPPVTVVCPGSGKAVQLGKAKRPQCPSCKRSDFAIAPFAPSRAFGLLPSHAKMVAAGSPEAALRLRVEEAP